MKRLKTAAQLALITIIISLLSYFSYPGSIQNLPGDTDSTAKYVNGTYTGMSRHLYRDEPYWGKVRIKIADGKICSVGFSIRDSMLHEDFNQSYERHFDTIPLYVQQCRNDWNGVKTYPRVLLNKQDINKVDAISGATWSYNIFHAAVDSALKNAVLKQP